MEEKKEPHLTIWIAITILSINQFIWTYQNYRSHQLLWDSVENQAQIVKEHIKSVNEWLTELNSTLERSVLERNGGKNYAKNQAV